MKNGEKTTTLSLSDALSDEAIEWLVLLNSGTVTTADRERFHTWRQTSSAHERAAREAEALWNDLLFVQDQPLTAEQCPHSHFVSFLRSPWTVHRAVGVTVVAALVLVIVLGLDRSELLLSGWFADYHTATGEQRSVTLSDGSIVHLNSHTALSIDFSETVRRLILHRGQALFSVARDTVRPFEVVAAGGKIRALGTQFEVSHHHEEVTVTVIEHEVDVALERRGRETLEESAMVVSQGKRVRYSSAYGFSKREDTDLVVALAWRRGKLIFKQRPLVEVVAEVNRYRRGWITILDSQVAALQVTGVFELHDPDAALRTIENTLPVQVVSLPYVTVLY